MKKHPRKITSAILASVILAGSIPFAVAAPPQSSETSSDDSSSTESVISNIQPIVTGGVTFVATPYYYYPSHTAQLVISSLQPVNENIQYIDASALPQPTYEKSTPLTLNLNDEDISYLEDIFSPIKVDRPSDSSPQTNPENAPAKGYKPLREMFKSTDEYLKLFKSQNEKAPKAPNAYKDSIEEIKNHLETNETRTLNEAFKCVSDYIFNASYQELQKTQNYQNINYLKNAFINSKNLNLLEIVECACMSCINSNTKLRLNRKECIKNFIELSHTLTNSDENAYIVALIYAQILNTKYPPFPAPSVSESIKIISQNLSKKLASMNELNIKPIKVAQDIAQVNAEKKSYFSFYRSIINYISHSPMDTDTLYSKIRMNPYLNHYIHPSKPKW